MLYIGCTIVLTGVLYYYFRRFGAHHPMLGASRATQFLNGVAEVPTGKAVSQITRSLRVPGRDAMHRRRDQSPHQFHRPQRGREEHPLHYASQSIALGGSESGVNGKIARHHAGDRWRRIWSGRERAMERQSDKHSSKWRNSAEANLVDTLVLVERSIIYVARFKSFQGYIKKNDKTCRTTIFIFQHNHPLFQWISLKRWITFSMSLSKYSEMLFLKCLITAEVTSLINVFPRKTDFNFEKKK